MGRSLLSGTPCQAMGLSLEEPPLPGRLGGLCCVGRVLSHALPRWTGALRFRATRPFLEATRRVGPLPTDFGEVGSLLSAQCGRAHREDLQNCGEGCPGPAGGFAWHGHRRPAPGLLAARSRVFVSEACAVGVSCRGYGETAPGTHPAGAWPLRLPGHPGGRWAPRPSRRTGRFPGGAARTQTLLLSVSFRSDFEPGAQTPSDHTPHGVSLGVSMWGSLLQRRELVHSRHRQPPRPPKNIDNTEW